MWTAWNTSRRSSPFKSRDALSAQDVWSLALEQGVQPLGDALPVQRTLAGQRDACDVLILMGVAAGAVIVAMVVVAMSGVAVPAVLVVDVARLAVGRVQERRLQVQDAVKVEAAPLQDQLKVDICTLRPMDRSQGVQPPQPLLHRR